VAKHATGGSSSSRKATPHLILRLLALLCHRDDEHADDLREHGGAPVEQHSRHVVEVRLARGKTGVAATVAAAATAAAAAAAEEEEKEWGE
jgi:hypothetical protein